VYESFSFFSQKSFRTLNSQISTMNDHNRISFVLNRSLSSVYWVSFVYEYVSFFREKSVRTLKYEIATINNHNRVSFVVNRSL